MSIVDDYRVPEKAAEPSTAPIIAPERYVLGTYIDFETYSPMPRRKPKPVTYIDIETRLMGDDWWEEMKAVVYKEGDDPVKIIEFNS